MGTLGGMAKAHGPGGALWIDAHGDLNLPETSPSGNVHGMPLAAALGVAGEMFETPRPGRHPRSTGAALLGRVARRGRAGRCSARLGLRVFTMSEIDRIGVERAVRDSLAFLAGASFVHVSVDLDAVDPMFAPGVGRRCAAGCPTARRTWRWSSCAESGLLDSLELVEVNPILDRENETAALAVELAASALGARIL